MMIRALRLLVVDDSEDDVLLIERHLKRADYHCHLKRVENATELMRELSTDDWDLLITDHRMPGFDSHKVVQLVKAQKPELPIIIVSGEIGEDIAVEVMSSGADDYVMKDNLRRLIPVIERELSGAGERRARQRAESKLRHMAYHDPLTNLSNRHEFNRVCQRVWRDTHETGVEHVMMYMDLDQFKVVNDTCGHLAGDEMLMQLAVVLRFCVREQDTLSRLGGDEFGLLLENCPLSRALHLAQKIKNRVNEFRFAWRHKFFSVGISIGVVVLDHSVHSASDALARADLACYAAKERGRNRIEVYRSDDDHIGQRRGEMEWVSDIRIALEQDRFTLMAQPIVPVAEKNATKNHEILIRMIGRDGELIPPGAFIPAAERYNLMPDIDRWVVTKVLEFDRLRQAKQKTKQKPGALFVNLSGTSLSDPGFLQFLESTLAQANIKPGRMVFEITETAAIANLSSTIELVKVLRRNHCAFALDDFGSGMSSFSYLKQLPLDYLKIDGGFVRNMLNDKLDLAIIEASHHIAVAAGLKTIAEFVETDEIFAALAPIGINFAQGWALGRPIPMELV